MKTWQLQDAKNRLSEVVRRAETEGPQVITVRGREAVVVLDREEYARLCPEAREGTLLEFFRNSPLRDVEIPLYRDDDETLRDLDLE